MLFLLVYARRKSRKSENEAGEAKMSKDEYKINIVKALGQAGEKGGAA